MKVTPVGKSSASAFVRMIAGARPPEQRNLPSMLQEAARLHPDKPHLTIGERTMSFSQCRDRAAAVAGQLAARGIRPGDRVALMCRNRIEFVEFLMGCFWLRAIVVPINPALRGAQLVHVLGMSGTGLLVLDGGLIAHIAALAPITSLKEVWPLDPVPEGVANLDRLCIVGSPQHWQPNPPPVIAAGDPSAILFTSGTTGASKGALCPAAQFYWWAEYQTAAMTVESTSVLFNALPLHHINAINTVCQSLLTGARCVIGERFSATGFWRAAAESGATHTSLIGVMANFLIAQPPGEWDQAHRVGTLIASSVRADIWPAFAARFGVSRRVGGYGSTETNLVFNADDGWDVPGNMGFATEGFEVAVVDAQDQPVPAGTAGELVVRSQVPFVHFLCYWGNPDATLSTCRNLWFHTGDLVVRDTTGRFRFVGRLKESIRRRGENISAWEVEQSLLEHPAIADAAAFGVPCELSSEDVMAVIVVRPGASARPDEICAFLESRLARFAIPRYLELSDALPLTDTGKVNRSKLKERGLTAATWDREAVGGEPHVHR